MANGSLHLVGIVIAFFYQGDNINRLTAPISFRKLETFDELFQENYTLYVPFLLQAELQSMHEFVTTFRKQIEYDWSFYRRQTTVKDNTFAKLYEMKHFLLNDSEILSRLKVVIKVPETEEEVFDSLKPGYFFNQIVRCRRDAYVDTTNNVIKLKLKLQLGGIDEKKITVSKVPYESIYENWDFSMVAWPVESFTKRTGSVLQSGMVQLWKKWEFRISTWNDSVATARNESVVVKGISTGDNFVVVFYIHLSFLSMCILVFTIEARLVILRGFAMVHKNMSVYSLKFKFCPSKLIGLFQKFPTTFRSKLTN